MNALERWLNTFGGNTDLKPDTPNDNKLTRWSADAANKNLKPDTPTVPALDEKPAIPRTSARPTNAAGTVEQTTNNAGKVNWRLGNQGQSIPRGKQPVPVVESTGRKVVPSLNNASAGTGSTAQARIGAPPKWELPWKTPKISVSSVLGAPAAGAEAMFHSESLNVGEFAGEDGQAWLDENRPEGWTSSTMSVESDIMSRTARDSNSKIKEVGLAEEKLNVLIESGASASLINQAKAELSAIKDTPTKDHLTDHRSEVEEELAEVQTLLDLKIQEFYVAGNPELTQQKLKASGWLDRKDALVNKLTDIDLIDKSNKVQQDKEAAALISMTKGMDPSKLTPQLGSLDEETIELLKKTGDKGLNSFFNGETLNKAMSLAAKGLGSLWDDTAIRNAFVYYMGSRLMGYSASGSGMAAGDVLIKGWDNQADAGALAAEAATKSAENNNIDMSKTVNYVDQYGKFQKVYASKNGKFLNHPKLGTIDVSKTGWRPAATGEKDRQTRKLDATDSVNKIQDQVLNNLRSQTKDADGNGMYDENNVAKVTQMFQEAGLSQQMVDSYTDSYGIDGLEKSIPMLRRAMESYSSAVADGEEVKVASLMGHLDRAMITSGKTQVPKSVYHSEGKVVGSDSMNTLSEKLTKVHQVQKGYIDVVKASPDLTDDQKEEFTYSMKTGATKADILIQLNKSFNAITPNHMDFWKKQAKDSNKSSPFIMWLTSVTDPGRQHSSYESLNINVYRDLGLIPPINKKE